MVGISGISAERFFSAIAIGRMRSDFSVIIAGTLPNSTCTCPPIRSTSAGFMPLLGTCTISMPAMPLSISPARCEALPTPAELKLSCLRIGLGVGDELAERLRRHRGMHDQRIGADRDVDDRREILRDVVGRRLVHRDRQRQAARRVEQGVAVGRRGDHRLRADHAGGARRGSRPRTAAPAARSASAPASAPSRRRRRPPPPARSRAPRDRDSPRAPPPVPGTALIPERKPVPASSMSSLSQLVFGQKLQRQAHAFFRLFDLQHMGGACDKTVVVAALDPERLVGRRRSADRS